MKIWYLIFVFILAITSCNQDKCKRRFDQLVWAENHYFRHLLVDGLIDSEKLNGLTREEVVLFLGPTYRYKKDRVIYGLGIPKGEIKPRETIFFIIEFDTHNVVSKYYVNPDPT